MQDSNWMWLLTAAVSGGILLYQTLGGASGVTAAEATLLLNREDALVVDVRETSEWATGHIPQARHIALGQLSQRISELEKFKDRSIIVCCASGNRSSGACNTLKKAGFAKVFNLRGGMASWSEAGMPVTRKG